MGKDQGGCCIDIFSGAQAVDILRQMKRGSKGLTLVRANIILVESIALSGLHLRSRVNRTTIITLIYLTCLTCSQDHYLYIYSNQSRLYVFRQKLSFPLRNWCLEDVLDEIVPQELGELTNRDPNTLGKFSHIEPLDVLRFSWSIQGEDIHRSRYRRNYIKKARGKPLVNREHASSAQTTYSPFSTEAVAISNTLEFCSV